MSLQFTFKHERNRISKDQALESLPKEDSFRVCFYRKGEKLSRAGDVLRAKVIEKFSTAQQIYAVGGYPNLPFINAIHIQIDDVLTWIIDFEDI